MLADFDNVEETVGLLTRSDDLPFMYEKKRQLFNRTRRDIYLDVARCYSSKVTDRAGRLLVYLLPSFLAVHFNAGSSRPHSPTLRPTAYLDGLRGVAAWTVFNAHLSALLIKSSGGAFLHDGPHKELYKLPIVRLMYDGDFAVALFFIISGFALSIGPLAAMKTVPRNADAAMRKLAGTIVRRPIRLYFPAWASMLLVFLLIRFGMFDILISRQVEFEEYIWGWPVIDEWPARMATFSAQFRDVLRDMFGMLSVFESPFDQAWHVNYNGVLWTVKLEFRSSIILYLTHTALFFVRKPLRIATALALITMGLGCWAFDFPLFWFGYLLAEYHTVSSPDDEKLSNFSLRAICLWIFVIIGGLIGSFPAWDPAGTPWYAWMIPLTPFNYLPTDRFWTSLGGAIVMYCIPRLPSLRAVYESKIVQYMGQISFGFYLVHFWIVHVFGTLIFYNVWSVTGKDGYLPTISGFVVAYAMLLACTVWAADLFWRFVDQPSVIFAAKVEKWALQDR